jgi:hypothetical protein
MVTAEARRVELRSFVSNPTPKQPLVKSAESDRRRSTRVMLVMPVEVKWMSKDGPWVQEHAETEVVSQHGAMLKMKARLNPGMQIEIRRPSVGLSAKAKVVGVGNPSPDGMARVAVEMLSPSDAFWGVSFPSVLPAAEKPLTPGSGGQPGGGEKKTALNHTEHPSRVGASR